MSSGPSHLVQILLPNNRQRTARRAEMHGVAGFVLGAALERPLRLWTGLEGSKEDNHADS